MSQLMKGISSHSSAVLKLTSCELTKDLKISWQSCCRRCVSGEEAGQGRVNTDQWKKHHRTRNGSFVHEYWIFQKSFEVRKHMETLQNVYCPILQMACPLTFSELCPFELGARRRKNRRCHAILRDSRWVWQRRSSRLGGWDLTAIAMGTIPKWPSVWGWWMILGTCWFTQMIAGISHDIPWSWMDLMIFDYLCISSKHWV